MEFINPRMTIENTDAFFWVVRMEHTVSDCEHLDIRLKLAHDSSTSVGQLQEQLLRRAQETIAEMLSTPAPHTPGDA